MRKITTAAIAVAALVVAGGTGVAAGSQLVPEAKPQPAVVQAPESCMDALDKADTALQSAGDGYDVMSDIMKSVSKFDIDGITAGSKRLDVLGERLTVELDAYASARNTCREVK